MLFDYLAALFMAFKVVSELAIANNRLIKALDSFIAIIYSTLSLCRLGIPTSPFQLPN